MKVLLECLISKESGPMFTYGFAKGLLNNEVDVYVILPENIENRKDWLDLLGENHIFFLSKMFKKKHPFKLASELASVKKKFKNVEFDYFIDTFPQRISLLLRIALSFNESIGLLHDVIPHSSTNSQVTKKIKNTISKFDYIVVLSKQYLSVVQEEYKKDEGHVLYLRHGAMEYPKVAFSKVLNNTVNFLYFGRIDGYKGLHVLAEAYRKLCLCYKNITLTVAGNGDFSEYRENYEDLPNCTIDNRYLSDDDIAFYFGKPNTVVVLPYIDATQSGVIGMCFNYWTPVIVSDTGGLKEQLFEGEMGLFVTPGDSDDLCKKMKAFLDNDKLYESQQKLMEDGYKRSSWNYVVKEFLEELNAR